jgi:hypothetical protein
VATPELFPTDIRTVGHSSCTAVQKLGSFLAPYLVLSNQGALSIGIVLGVLNAIAAVVVHLLPETTGTTVCDT